MSLPHGDLPGPIDADLTGLALRAGDGDDHAKNELLTSVRLVAHRYCRARLASLPGGPSFADDAAQEVCLAVLAGLHRYEDRGLPFNAWVYGIASRKVADVLRRELRAPVLVDEVPDTADEDADPIAGILAGERHAQVHRLLATLTPVQREILILRIAVGFTADEAGEALNMSAGAVRVAQHRALASLRRRVLAEENA